MYYFIVNPSSSSGKGLKIYQAIEPVLKKEQIPYQVFLTKSSAHTAYLAREISEKHAPCIIVAVGGDGTVNDVLNGLCNLSSVVFGYIPTGSGNDLCRGLHLPTKPQDALRAILSPKVVRPVSVGVLTCGSKKRRFLVSSGIGFDAEVCRQAQRSPLKDFLNRLRLGKLTYAGTALGVLFHLKSSPLTLAVDGNPPKRLDGFLFAAAMNLKYEGGGFMFCPDASAKDDVLDLILVERMAPLKILLLLPTALVGKHTSFSGIHICRFKTASLQLDKPLITHTDGEPQGEQPSIVWSLEQERLPFILK